jgi:protein gp37
MAKRMRANAATMSSPSPAMASYLTAGDAGFAPTFDLSALVKPLRIKKPRRIGVSFMGDLFDPGITDEQIAAVFGVMAACPQHTFFVLTKRAERMRQWFAATPPLPTHTYGIIWDLRPAAAWDVAKTLLPTLAFSAWDGEFRDRSLTVPWPLPNVLLGVTVENQQRADERIPLLLQCPAAVHWVSLEPMLEAVDLRPWLHVGMESWAEGHPESPVPNHAGGYSRPMGNALSWVIVGGESGPNARPMHPAWPRSVRDRCETAGVPFYFKQSGGRGKDNVHLPELDGVRWEEFPPVSHG